MAAEKATISSALTTSSRLTASLGAVSSTPFEMFARSELLLITARVKGGFSGGPILDETGYCVGVISRTPEHERRIHDAADDLAHRYDDLGYGTAIPAHLVLQFLSDIDQGGAVFSQPMDMHCTDFEEFIE